MAEKKDAPIADVSKEGLEFLTTVLKAKRDPAFFIREILEMDMWPAQEAMVREFYQHKYNPTLPAYREAILAWGQRSGKTAIMGGIGAYEFFDICTIEDPAAHYGLTKKQPIFIPVIAPSIDQAKDGIFQNIANNIENSEWLTQWFDWKVLSEEIRSLTKNVTVQCFGSWATTARGRTSKAVIIDECDQFEETTSKRGGFEVYAAMKNSTTTLGKDGHVFCISSTKSPNGMILTLHKESEHQSNVLRQLKPTWEVNPHITKEALMEEYKYRLPQFWRDFGCNPSVWNSLQFPEGVILKDMPNVLDELYTARSPYIHVMAIDPAVKNDAFGMACGYIDNTGRFIVDGAIAFRRTDGEVILRPSTVKDFLRKKFPQLNVVVFIHDTWMFPDISEMAIYDFGIIDEQHIVKKKEYDIVRSLMLSGQCDIVYNRELKLELEALEVTKAATPNVNHPSTGSKDTADCVANVVNYLYEHQVELMGSNTITLCRGF